MSRVRISVTELDQYRYFLDSDYSDFEQYKKQVLGQQEQTEPMKVGHAFAKLRERMGAGEHTEMMSEGYTFYFDLEYEIDLMPAREIKEEKTLLINGTEVTLVGKVDSVAGLVVYDDKFTENYDPDRYFDSQQWRAYLAMFGAKKFIYNIFIGKIKGLDVYINDFNRLPLFSYPGIADDVVRALDEYVDFLKRYAPERITQ